MRNAILAAICAGVLSVAAAAQTPRPSPPFAILRAGAPQIQLSQYRGKVVALAFIHTTCPHCQDLTRVLSEIAKVYQPRGVQFLECAFNADAATLVPIFVQQYQPPFPVGYSNDGAVRVYLQYPIFDTAKPFYVPHMVFLDRKGMIRDDYPGESGFFQNPVANIRAELEKLLAPETPAKKAEPTAKKQVTAAKK